ncbi:hypothetical protein ACFORJ_12210 [Corynebacterium hansenii]|uniref:FCS-type domain-containing protein n=1 Tax=Corynebacterium hansenii TaxID=394964 RepID=A0ABV7ZU41_9CORY|nr:hypothetical protein [Corynebacterium hansenii]WJZ00066.1 hypothetical protein CHAN_07260 [Corynebacterium hansenii]
MTVNDTAHCEWCGREIALSPRGRRRKYCDQTCRQRAYEHRRAEAAAAAGAGGAGAGERAAGLSDERLATLRDGLFALRCAAEDVETAVGEGADAGEVAAMCRELVVKARELEHFR